MSTQKRDPREILLDAIHEVDEALEPTNHKEPGNYDYQGPSGEFSVWLTETLKEELMSKLCAFLGHRPEMDQCGRPEHDLCTWCQASTPGEAPGRPGKILDTFTKGIEDPEFNPTKEYHGFKASE